MKLDNFCMSTCISLNSTRAVYHDSSKFKNEYLHNTEWDTPKTLLTAPIIISKSPLIVPT